MGKQTRSCMEELELMSGFCSWHRGAGTDADSEQGGRRTIPSKLLEEVASQSTGM